MGAPRGRYGLTRVLHDAVEGSLSPHGDPRSIGFTVCGARSYGPADAREERRNGYLGCKRCAAIRLRRIRTS